MSVIDDPRTDSEIKGSKQKALLHFLAGLVGFLMALAVVTSLLFNIVQIGRLTEIAETNRANGQRLIDCTTPGGQCFEDGNDRTGEAIGTINEVTILAASCVQLPGIDTEAEIRECIEQGLNP